MPSTKSTYLSAVSGQNHNGETPVWLMRQAGRYMPSYREIRERYAFLDMVYTPEIACEVTLLPIHELGVSAAILFSDILVIPQALGLDLQFIPGQGPVFSNALKTQQDVKNLWFDEGRLSPIYEAIGMIQGELDGAVPLIGFAGAPFTVASYMFQRRDLHKVSPSLLSQTMSIIADATADYLISQVKAGVDALQLFDTWALHMSPAEFNTLNLPVLQQVIAKVRAVTDCPITYFCKQIQKFADSLGELDVQVIGVDHESDAVALRAQFPNYAIQGNLPPETLYLSESEIEAEAGALLKAFANDPAYVFNLGHGLAPDMDQHKVKHLVEFVKNATYSAV